MPSPTHRKEIILIDDIVLICTADDKQWWQRRETAKSHISALFSTPKPVVGDLLIECGEGPTRIRRILRVNKKGLVMSPPYAPHYPEERGISEIRRLNLKTGDPNYYRPKGKD